VNPLTGRTLRDEIVPVLVVKREGKEWADGLRTGRNEHR
jgi:hypothetical protein